MSETTMGDVMKAISEADIELTALRTSHAALLGALKAAEPIVLGELAMHKAGARDGCRGNLNDVVNQIYDAITAAEEVAK